MRCPYCRDDVTPGDRLVTCLGCNTLFHEECIEDRGCTTLGCANAAKRPEVVAAPAPPPRRTPSEVGPRVLRAASILAVAAGCFGLGYWAMHERPAPPAPPPPEPPIHVSYAMNPARYAALLDDVRVERWSPVDGARVAYEPDGVRVSGLLRVPAPLALVPFGATLNGRHAPLTWTDPFEQDGAWWRRASFEARVSVTPGARAEVRLELGGGGAVRTATRTLAVAAVAPTTPFVAFADPGQAEVSFSAPSTTRDDLVVLNGFFPSGGRSFTVRVRGPEGSLTYTSVSDRFTAAVTLPGPGSHAIEVEVVEEGGGRRGTARRTVQRLP